MIGQQRRQLHRAFEGHGGAGGVTHLQAAQVYRLAVVVHGPCAAKRIQALEREAQVVQLVSGVAGGTRAV